MTGNRRPDVKSGAVCLILRDGCKHTNRYTKNTPVFTYLDPEIENTKIPVSNFHGNSRLQPGMFFQVP